MAQLHTLWMPLSGGGDQLLIDSDSVTHSMPWTGADTIATRRSDQEVARRGGGTWFRYDGSTTALTSVGSHTSGGIAAVDASFDAAGNLWASSSASGGTIGRWDGSSWTTWTGLGGALGFVNAERSDGTTPIVSCWGSGAAVSEPLRSFDPATGTHTDLWRAADIPLNAIPGWYEIVFGHIRSAVSLPDHSGWLVSIDQVGARASPGGSIVSPAGSACGVVTIDNAGNFVDFWNFHATGSPLYKVVRDGLGGIWVTGGTGGPRLVEPDGTVLATVTLPAGSWSLTNAQGGPALAPAPTGFTLGLHFGPRRGGFH